MPRSLIALFIVAITAQISTAELLPDRIGSFRKITAGPADAPEPAVFKEFGFVSAETGSFRGTAGKGTVTAHQIQDATGALAAFDWLRPADARRCELADHCAVSGRRTLLSDANYVLEFDGFSPRKADVQSLIAALPKRHPSDLPPVVSFVPLKDVIPNSARYILGPESLRAVAPELADAKPGFDQGAEAHYTAYRLGGAPVKLVLFDYPSPEMARLHTVNFKLVPGAQVKRSGVLVAVILPGAAEKQAEALLDQVKYAAKILWNEPPPPNPVPTLYKLLMNIIIASCVLVALCLAAGLMYGMMRLYRRRYGTLGEQETMTTLGLSRE